MNLIVVLLVLLLVFGGLPQVGLHQYGYGPSSLGGVLLIVLLILLLTGRL